MVDERSVPEHGCWTDGRMPSADQEKRLREETGWCHLRSLRAGRPVLHVERKRMNTNLIIGVDVADIILAAAVITHLLVH